MRTLPLTLLSLFCMLACKPSSPIEKDWSKLFGAKTGCFVLYDLKRDQHYVYEFQRCVSPFIPASTFKIFNSLVALETGVVPDLDYVQKWDSVSRQVPVWNQDHDFRSAFRNSVVWYYQEVARKIGADRMQEYIDREGYGNQDINGGIDQFWLSGALRISPMEQVAFLKRLYLGELEFSERSMNLTKELMELESGEGYTLYGKTGWSTGVDPPAGWFVGFLEIADGTWIFANQLEMDESIPGIGNARLEISRAILQQEGLLPNP